MEDLEKTRIEVEIARHKAERQKLELESEQITKNLNQKWYKGKFFLETIVAGLVASGLLAAWVIIYLQPIITIKHEIAELENEKLDLEKLRDREQHFQEKKKLDARLTLALAENEATLSELAEQQAQAKSLQEQFQELSKNYDVLLSQVDISDNERKRITKLSGNAQDQIRTLDTKIADLVARRKKQKINRIGLFSNLSNRQTKSKDSFGSATITTLQRPGQLKG